MIQFLLDHGADATVVDSFGLTAVDRAIKTGDHLVLKQLQSQ